MRVRTAFKEDIRDVEAGGSSGGMGEGGGAQPPHLMSTFPND